MIGIFGRQNMNEGRFDRQSVLDQPGRSLGLYDAISADSAGVFGTAGDDRVELRNDAPLVTPLQLRKLVKRSE
ncbi:hypothetical protein [Bradyrhizobium sp. SZCCHNR1018]|uniref:hypothetical protein n=1 Tax=unclassified Bradyrhizobium TaxID=2631580 RepID=UPI0039656B44